MAGMEGTMRQRGPHRGTGSQPKWERSRAALGPRLGGTAARAEKSASAGLMAKADAERGKAGLEDGVERREDVLQLADQAVVALLEDGGVLVLVDGEDDAGAVHAHHVLHLAGDAGGDVDLRG